MLFWRHPSIHLSVWTKENNKYIFQVRKVGVLEEPHGWQCLHVKSAYVVITFISMHPGGSNRENKAFAVVCLNSTNM